MTRWIAAALLVVAMLAAPSAGQAQTQGQAPAQAQAQAPMQIKGATTVDAEKVIALIDAEKELVILDNRRAEDFNAGHIAGAQRILDTDLTEAKMAQLVPSKTRPVLCYCNGLACGRAAKAAAMAVEWGYTRVHYYALGMDEWKQLGLPLTTAQ